MTDSKREGQTQTVTMRTIRLLGDPVLRTPCRNVTEFDDGLAALVDDLLETVHQPGRAGLAAPQIGVSLRVFSYYVDDQEGYVVNPVLVSTDGEQDGEEGCLSIPGVWAETPRAARAVVRGVDVDGKAIEVAGTGMMARCLQHEVDHLDGMLFVDRLKGKHRKEAMRAIRERELLS